MSAPIQEDALRVGVLTTLKDLIVAELEAGRADVLDELLELNAAAGVRKIDIQLPGEGIVGTISVTIPQGKPSVGDEQAFGEWVKATHPTRTRTHHVVKAEHLAELAAQHPEWVTSIEEPEPAFVTGLLDGLEISTGEQGEVQAIDPMTGEIVPGIKISRPRAPSITVKLGGENRTAIASAWREGRLPAALAAIGGGAVE